METFIPDKSELEAVADFRKALAENDKSQLATFEEHETREFACRFCRPCMAGFPPLSRRQGSGGGVRRNFRHRLEDSFDMPRRGSRHRFGVADGVARFGIRRGAFSGTLFFHERKNADKRHNNGGYTHF